MSTKDSYGTPRAVFDYYHRQYRFKLDAAASDNNHLCRKYITAEQNTHDRDWFSAAFALPGKNLHQNDRKHFTGQYAWMNPPYSDIGPFVETAIKWQAQGFGTVMLVMMDQSVGWYKRAIEHCQEVHLVIGGRLSFIDPVTGKPANGNNKCSMFLVFHPFGKPCMPIYQHIERDQLLKGAAGIGEPASGDISATIEYRPDDSDHGERAGGESDANEAAQLDIEDQIARDSATTNSVWPNEVLALVEQAFRAYPNTKTELRQQMLCERVNQRLLDNASAIAIITEINTMLARCERVEEAA